MRINVHFQGGTGEFLQREADRKGISLSNEVKQRLAAACYDDRAEETVEHIARSLQHHNGGTFADWLPTARAIVSGVPPTKQPYPTRNPVGS